MRVIENSNLSCLLRSSVSDLNLQFLGFVSVFRVFDLITKSNYKFKLFSCLLRSSDS